MKRVILSGGGTGGHIYPAITIAREIEELEKADILFVGTRMVWNLLLYLKKDSLFAV